MSNIKVTSHALKQYESRTGRNSLDTIFSLMNALDSAKVVSFKEATNQGFTIVKQFKGDRYLIWHDGNIKEDVCGIVTEDNALKTVLTKNIYSWANRGSKLKSEYRFTGGV
jgi:hypothetical protein